MRTRKRPASETSVETRGPFDEIGSFVILTISFWSCLRCFSGRSDEPFPDERPRPPRPERPPDDLLPFELLDLLDRPELLDDLEPDESVLSESFELLGESEPFDRPRPCPRRRPPRRRLREEPFFSSSSSSSSTLSRSVRPDLDVR